MNFEISLVTIANPRAQLTLLNDSCDKKFIKYFKV